MRLHCVCKPSTSTMPYRRCKSKKRDLINTILKLNTTTHLKSNMFVVLLFVEQKYFKYNYIFHSSESERERASRIHFIIWIISRELFWEVFFLFFSSFNAIQASPGRAVLCVFIFFYFKCKYAEKSLLFYLVWSSRLFQSSFAAVKSFFFIRFSERDFSHHRPLMVAQFGVLLSDSYRNQDAPTLPSSCISIQYDDYC
jgi:hypothetical protein